MTHAHDDEIDDIKKAAAEKNAQAWIDESKGQAEKWVGKVTGDKIKETAGAAKQSIANADKHITGMIKDQVSI
ncbi:MAG: hypothetical protein KBD00_00345 [Candidatus Peribacteraceae bacterium]|nr:hypothetical protein [Candidatus Peribacteraceae bacterium]